MILIPRTLVLFGYGLLVMLLSLRSMRANRLKERHVLLFLMIGLPFLVLAVWPDGIVVLADLLGMEVPTAMILCLAGFLILVIFELLSIVSVQERKITRLAQEVSLLRQAVPPRQAAPRES